MKIVLWTALLVMIASMLGSAWGEFNGILFLNAAFFVLNLGLYGGITSIVSKILDAIVQTAEACRASAQLQSAQSAATMAVVKNMIEEMAAVRETLEREKGARK